MTLALLVGGLLTGCGEGDGQGATEEDDAKPSTITVRATGEAEGRPDLLTVVLGVQTRAASAQDALGQNNELATKLLERLREGGVQEQDVQTSGLSINPTYDNQGGITGYEVANTVTARLRDLTTAGSLIDAAASVAGDAIRIQGLSFSIDDTSELLGAAREDAVTRARRQAEQLASAADLRLGRVRSIEESPPATPPMPYAFDTATEGASAASVPLAPGSQELTLHLTVVFEVT